MILGIMTYAPLLSLSAITVIALLVQQRLIFQKKKKKNVQQSDGG